MCLSKFISKKTKKILVVDDGRYHSLRGSGDKQFLDGEEVTLMGKNAPVFVDDELENRKSPKRTLRERLYKHIRIEKAAVNAPKRQSCPKCQAQARRVRKSEGNANMPAMAYYKCRCKKRFEIILKGQ